MKILLQKNSVENFLQNPIQHINQVIQVRRFYKDSNPPNYICDEVVTIGLMSGWKILSTATLRLKEKTFDLVVLVAVAMRRYSCGDVVVELQPLSRSGDSMHWNFQ
jgi:hypothetical protein